MQASASSAITPWNEIEKPGEILFGFKKKGERFSEDVAAFQKARDEMLRSEGVAVTLRDAGKHFGLLFTGVDLMETPDGGFIVLEVSAFGGFRGLLNGCGIDAAPMLAEVVLRRFREARR